MENGLVHRLRQELMGLAPGNQARLLEAVADLFETLLPDPFDVMEPDLSRVPLNRRIEYVMGQLREAAAENDTVHRLQQELMGLAPGNQARLLEAAADLFETLLPDPFDVMEPDLSCVPLERRIESIVDQIRKAATEIKR